MEIWKNLRRKDRASGECEKFQRRCGKKQHDIAEIQKTILASSDSHGELEQKLRESVEQKEQMSAEYRGFSGNRRKFPSGVTDWIKKCSV